MRIQTLEVWREVFPLSRPYSIAFRSTDTVDNFIVRVETDSGIVGLGAASPEEFVTGESVEGCEQALSPESLGWMEGWDLEDFEALTAELEEQLPGVPAARAAVDMALYDLVSQKAGLPLAAFLGQKHKALPTSITIGIKSLEDTLTEADEYLGRGFRVLKLKLGSGLEEDVERTVKLREHVGRSIAIRVDMNQAHDAETYLKFLERTRDCFLEFAEQPLKAEELEAMRNLPQEVRQTICVDESFLDDKDALRACTPRPAGRVLNVKLMKCGGITTALRIGQVAESHGRELMWGCMDESRISITAALHAAFACSATRYLDLDGSLDLARDVAGGGFELEGGVMTLTSEPGLGVRLLS